MDIIHVIMLIEEGVSLLLDTDKINEKTKDLYMEKVYDFENNNNFSIDVSREDLLDVGCYYYLNVDPSAIAKEGDTFYFEGSITINVIEN